MMAAVAILSATLVAGAVQSEASLLLIDNSGFTATASTTIGSGSRFPSRAVNGAGLIYTPGPGGVNNPANYAHDAGGDRFGVNLNWMTTNAGGAHTTGWFKVDLGQSYELGQVSFFNFNPNGTDGNEDRGVSSAKVWYLNAASDPNANNNGNDLAFLSAGWTQLPGPGTDGAFAFAAAPAGNVNQTTPDVLAFNAAEAQFVAFEILANHGDATFVGIGEVQFFAVPEPTSLLGVLAVVGLSLLGRRRRSLC